MAAALFANPRGVNVLFMKPGAPTSGSLAFTVVPSLDGGMNDGGAGDAATGVTCVVERATTGVCSTWSTTIEQNVPFWYVSVQGYPKGALATSSPGINAFYLSQPGTGLFTSSDDTNYSGYSSATGEGHVSGATLTFTMDAGRGYIGPCTPPIYLIDVQCSGGTTLP